MVPAIARRHLFALALSLFVGGIAQAEPVSLPQIIAHAHDTSTALAFDKYPAMRDLAATGKKLTAEWIAENGASPSLGAVKRLEKGFMALAEDVGEKAWRQRVAELQAGLIELVRASEDLKAQWNLYWCPMVKRYWTQPAKEDMANAYMGTTMLECGVQKKWNTLPKDVKGWP